MKELMSNGFANSIAQAIEEMKVEQGDSFSLEHVNLAELERRTGVSRGKLRRLKRNGFQDLPRKTKGSKHKVTKLSGYTGLIDSLLKQGIKNSSVILDRLQQAGYEGGATIVKEYIESLAQDDRSQQLVKMVMSLLARSANGALKASRVVRLHKLADESGDQRFIEGVRIIEAAYRPAISRTYIRCEVRNIDPETQVIKDWEALPLGMTES